MTRVKICGIQQPDHAIVAAEAGADLIGLVFVPRRHRCLSTGAARKIVEDLKAHAASPPRVVGLFADQPLEEVNRTIRDCRLDLAQLCGNESPHYCQMVQAQVIKVLHVANPPNSSLEGGESDLFVDVRPGPADAPPFGKAGPGGTSNTTGQRDTDEPDMGPLNHLAGQVRTYVEAECLVTLDRLVEGLQGGTGQGFNWEIAAELSRRGHSFLLAGGLTPDNVARAVATVRPWGVDVSSGVETGGVKDPEKIRDFVRNAKEPVR